MLVENPSFENLNTVKELFADFADKAFEIQSKFHERIEYFDDLYNQKPTLCTNFEQLNGVVSLAQTIQISLPRLLSKLRKVYAGKKRLHPSEFGILVEIEDYSQEIKDVSENIMNAMQESSKQTMDKMGVTVTKLLGQQVDIAFWILDRLTNILDRFCKSSNFGEFLSESSRPVFNWC